MFNRFLPTAADPYEQLGEILNHYEGANNVRITLMKSDFPELVMYINSYKFERAEMNESHLLIQGENNFFTFLEKGLISVKDVYFPEEISLRKAAYEVYYEKERVVKVDILD